MDTHDFGGGVENFSVWWPLFSLWGQMVLGTISSYTLTLKT
jgi:hypothetical protein